MKNRPIARSAAAIVALALCSSAPPSHASAQPTTRARESRDDERYRCAAIRVTSPQQRGERRHRNGGFSATEILDLEIEVLFPATLEGQHRLDVKLYTPDNQLYQVLTVPFRAESATDSSAFPHGRHRRKLTDYPRPLREETSRPEHDGRRRYHGVGAVLPVAGTSIVTSSLYGTWTAVAYLDESPDSCASPRTFSITE